MNAFRVFKALGPIDARNVRRDSFLAWIVFLPILLALILRWGVPPLTTRLQEQFGFDLTPYYPVILSYFFVMTLPTVFGAVIGFLLLDERDDATLIALQVTPMTMNHYLVYRIAVPMTLTTLLMFVVFPLANLGSLGFLPLLFASLTAAPLAPLWAMLLAAFAENKVQGFALMKGSGFVLLVVPLFAYFVTSGWHWAFGLLPTFWPMKVYWVLEAGGSNVWVYVLVALAYQFTLLAFLMRRFNKVIHR
jgi:fluoroquinolone transport system permease protein